MNPKRVLRGFDAAAFAAVSMAMILGQFWALYLRPVSPLFHGQLFLGAVLALSFLLMRHRRHGSGDRIPWHDWLLAVLSFLPALHATWDYASFVRRTVLTTNLDIAMAGLIVLLILEACRRAVGWVLVILAVLFLGAALAGNIAWFGEAGVPTISLRRLAGTLYVSELGIFSEPIQVAVRWIFIFLLFGAFLVLAGAQDFFAALANSMNRGRRGGPAYVAVWSSAFFGTLSGSNMANVMTTGQFTIPLMRQAGYPPTVAAAIEAVASTGGALTPPVMAAGALIMAEFTGRPYFDIIAAAAIPAALFYLACLVYVRSITNRLDIGGAELIEAEAHEPVGQLLLRNWAILLSLVWLIYRIASFYPVERAGLEAIVPLLVGTLIHHRETLRRTILFERLSAFVASLLDVAVACAASGILVGVILLTGVGIELSNTLFSIGQGSLLLALLLTMLVTIVLGMGVPGIAAYVIAASVIAAPLIQIGIEPIAAHMFIFYFSLFAGLTPPVALTAFAAAGIAKTPPFRTALVAMVMAMPAYLIAYAFVIEPGLLLEADLVTVIYQSVMSILGVAIFAFATGGYLFRRLSWMERIAGALIGTGFIYPSAWGDLVAACLALLLVLWLRSSRSHSPAEDQKETNA